MPEQRDAANTEPHSAPSDLLGGCPRLGAPACLAAQPEVGPPQEGGRGGQLRAPSACGVTRDQEGPWGLTRSLGATELAPCRRLKRKGTACPRAWAWTSSEWLRVAVGWVCCQAGPDLRCPRQHGSRVAWPCCGRWVFWTAPAH